LVLGKLIFLLFCIAAHRGGRKGDPNINGVGTIQQKSIKHFV